MSKKKPETPRLEIGIVRLILWFPVGIIAIIIVYQYAGVIKFF